jgi:hypothetical protein
MRGGLGFRKKAPYGCIGAHPGSEQRANSPLSFPGSMTAFTYGTSILGDGAQVQRSEILVLSREAVLLDRTRKDAHR